MWQAMGERLAPPFDAKAQDGDAHDVGAEREGDREPHQRKPPDEALTHLGREDHRAEAQRDEEPEAAAVAPDLTEKAGRSMYVL